MFNPLFSFVRKFSHRHLAQIKYIVPEAIQIDKLLVHDEKTMCMKPDVKITLHFDAVEDHKEHSMFMTLSNLFASRLVDFLHKHAQVITLKVLEFNGFRGILQTSLYTSRIGYTESDASVNRSI